MPHLTASDPRARLFIAKKHLFNIYHSTSKEVDRLSSVGKRDKREKDSGTKPAGEIYLRGGPQFLLRRRAAASEKRDK